ncbi:MAG: hypothetical protein ACOYVJ_10505 [Nitrospirota bacterium]
MTDNVTKKENEFFQQVIEYQKAFRSSAREKLFAEREERLKRGEVFFEGYWVPKETVPEIQSHLSKKGKIVFAEVHLACFVMVLLSLFLMRIFTKFLLP